jgi:hypothetical protein
MIIIDDPETAKTILNITDTLTRLELCITQWSKTTTRRDVISVLDIKTLDLDYFKRTLC